MVLVRPATQDDLADVAAIHAVARHAYYRAGGYVPDPARELGVTGWRGYLADDDVTMACADVAGVLVGFACTRRRAGARLELLALYVEPAQWSRGVGSALHAWYLAELDRRGPDARGALEVWAGNTRALSFYAARGWRDETEERPGPLDMPFRTLSWARTR